MDDSDCSDGTCNAKTKKCQCALIDVDYYGSDLKKFTNVPTWQECGKVINRCCFVHGPPTLLIHYSTPMGSLSLSNKADWKDF